jgi:hypothetical protein
MPAADLAPLSVANIVDEHRLHCQTALMTMCNMDLLHIWAGGDAARLYSAGD